MRSNGVIFYGQGSEPNGWIHPFHSIEGKIYMKTRVTVVIEPDGDLFHAYCPDLPGIHVNGSSVEEACERTIPAIEWYLDFLDEQGDPIPEGPGSGGEVNKEFTELLSNRSGSTVRSVEVPWPSAAPI